MIEKTITCVCGHAHNEHGHVSTKKGRSSEDRKWKGQFKGQCLYSGNCDCPEFFVHRVKVEGKSIIL